MTERKIKPATDDEIVEYLDLKSQAQGAFWDRNISDSNMLARIDSDREKIKELEEENRRLIEALAVAELRNKVFKVTGLTKQKVVEITNRFTGAT